jgi:hypothetical protein
MVCVMLAEALTPVMSTGLKPRVLAAARMASMSRPAAVKSSVARSSVIQPSSMARDFPPSARTRSACSPVHELSTTFQP